MGSERKDFDGWAIKGPDGWLHPSSVDYIPGASWETLERRLGRTKDDLVDAGYRAVPVRLVEVEDTPDV